ncbi:hypothetical protein VX037_01715 [Gordonia sp. Z-3]|jgi:hypothetical protein|uniref:Uncharacterized protein n=2 Tax=Gordonia TaxID=2053 RepID=A0A9X3D897_9ACTN|nr:MULTISPECIES: hypothetical protein [Gordonia]MCF3939833.1 hypothetical protein [Gordonia tangerina]MCX2966542.1 hypothetical protein [Gordonia aquimaris]MED5799750.1 hypothetical protein [Gordonia sp. Z-3]
MADRPDDESEKEPATRDGAGTDPGGKRDGADEPRPIIPERFRDWGHVYKTRLRTSTAVLLIAFLGSSILYGYTSQRYGVVQPPAAPARTSVSTTVTPEPSWSSTPSSTSLTTTTTTTTDSVDGPDGDTEPEPGSGTGDTGTQTRSTVPGLPGVVIPNFGRTPETTTVPQR